MKFFLISDNVDTKMGMRFAGIEGVVVHQEDEVRSELEKAVNRDDIAVILITETLVSLCPDLIYDLKLNRKQPLIVEIPTVTVTEEPRTVLQNMFRTQSA